MHRREIGQPEPRLHALRDAADQESVPVPFGPAKEVRIEFVEELNANEHGDSNAEVDGPEILVDPINLVQHRAHLRIGCSLDI